MRAKWVQVVAGVALVVFVGAMVLVPLGMARGWFARVGDDWTHADLARHLKRRGAEVEVTKEVASGPDSTFRDPASKQRIGVIHKGSSRGATEYAQVYGQHWYEHFTAGPFFIGAPTSDDVPLLRRIEKALK